MTLSCCNPSARTCSSSDFSHCSCRQHPEVPFSCQHAVVQVLLLVENPRRLSSDRTTKNRAAQYSGYFLYKQLVSSYRRLLSTANSAMLCCDYRAIASAIKDAIPPESDHTAPLSASYTIPSGGRTLYNNTLLFGPGSGAGPVRSPTPASSSITTSVTGVANSAAAPPIPAAAGTNVSPVDASDKSGTASSSSTVLAGYVVDVVDSWSHGVHPVPLVSEHPHFFFHFLRQVDERANAVNLLPLE